MERISKRIIGMRMTMLSCRSYTQHTRHVTRKPGQSFQPSKSNKLKDGQNKDNLLWPQKEGEFLWGINAVKLAMESQHRRVIRLYTLEPSDRSEKKRERDLDEVERLARVRNIPVIYQMVGSKHSQGLVMEVDMVSVPTIEADSLAETIRTMNLNEPCRQAIILACDEVHDVHNFGSILRSAMLFGVDAVVTCENNAAPFSPVASVSSAGALEILAAEGRLFRASHLHSFLIGCQVEGWHVAGTHLDSESLAPAQLPADKPLVIVVGNEGIGLRSSIRKCCDTTIRIPMAADAFGSSRFNTPLRKHVDSLNVGVATGILLQNLLLAATRGR